MSARVRNAVIKFLGIVLGAAVLGAAVGGGVAALQPESYTSTTTVMVAPAQKLPNDQTETVSQYILSSMPTYNNLAKTSSVLQEAAGRGRSTDEISGDLEVEVPTGSSLIQLAYSDTDKERAAEIGDALAEGLRNSIRQYSPQSDGNPQVDVAVVQGGGSAVTDDKPSVSRWGLIGAVLGTILGLGCAQALTRTGPASRGRGASAYTSHTDSLSS